MPDKCVCLKRYFLFLKKKKERDFLKKLLEFQLLKTVQISTNYWDFRKRQLTKWLQRFQKIMPDEYLL